jgi:lipid-binding SYLF domain-containing protein
MRERDMHPVKTLLTVLVGLMFCCPPPQAMGGQEEIDEVRQATEVFRLFTRVPEYQIPPMLLRNAEAIAIIPGTITLGFMVAGRYGHGIMIGRDEQGEWGLPFFVNLLAGSLGWQFGLQATDTVLVFKNRKGLYHIRNGKFMLGGDAAVAAGPIGRRTEAATDIQLKSAIYSYSMSRGLYVGVSLEGAVLQADKIATENLYGREAAAISRETIQVPPAVQEFYSAIDQYTSRR